MSCICHFKGTQPSAVLTKLTAVTLVKLKQFAKEWQTLDKEPEKSMSTELLSDLNLKEGAEIHKPCYIRLTGVYKFEQAKKSLKKVSGFLGAGR